MANQTIKKGNKEFILLLGYNGKKDTEESKKERQAVLLKPVLKVQSCSSNDTAAFPRELCNGVPQADITHLKIQETQEVCA